uniref:Uncharacterized protein n=1 Tax=Kalanchoe fedtschenkoi TaxID=63787 RepID=A0A7N0ULL4_KALFE
MHPFSSAVVDSLKATCKTHVQPPSTTTYKDLTTRLTTPSIPSLQLCSSPPPLLPATQTYLATSSTSHHGI